MNFGKNIKKIKKIICNEIIESKLLRKIKIQAANQEATRVTALSHHTFSLRVVCHRRTLSACVMHAPGLANGNAPRVLFG